MQKLNTKCCTATSEKMHLYACRCWEWERTTIAPLKGQFGGERKGSGRGNSSLFLHTLFSVHHFHGSIVVLYHGRSVVVLWPVSPSKFTVRVLGKITIFLSPHQPVCEGKITVEGHAFFATVFLKVLVFLLLFRKVQRAKGVRVSYLSPCWRIKLPANRACGTRKLGSFTLF